MNKELKNERYNFNTIFVYHYNCNHCSRNYNYIIFNQNKKTEKKQKRKQCTKYNLNISRKGTYTATMV